MILDRTNSRIGVLGAIRAVAVAARSVEPGVMVLDREEALRREDTTRTLKDMLALALRQKPIPALDAGKGRIMYLAGQQ